jgi:hypothetical protein
MPVVIFAGFMTYRSHRQQQRELAQRMIERQELNKIANRPGAARLSNKRRYSPRSIDRISPAGRSDWQFLQQSLTRFLEIHYCLPPLAG